MSRAICGDNELKNIKRDNETMYFIEKLPKTSSQKPKFSKIHLYATTKGQIGLFAILKKISLKTKIKRKIFIYKNTFVH